MKLAFVGFLSSKDQWFEFFVHGYTKKINHLFPFEYHSLKSRPFPQTQWDSKVREECKQLFKFLTLRDRLILLDVKGRSFKDSMEFSRFLVTHVESGPKRLVFAVGGAYGFSPEVHSRALDQISLSSLTMSHQVAMVASLEQIYRGLSIWKGLPYHHENHSF